MKIGLGTAQFGLDYDKEIKRGLHEHFKKFGNAKLGKKENTRDDSAPLKTS
jgi:hypothetical protein